MKTIRVSATKARNNFFPLLQQVAAGLEVIIEKDKKDVAVLSQKKTKTNWEDLLKVTRETAGILKDEPYDPEDNPLRRKGAAGFLGRWDRDLVKKRK